MKKVSLITMITIIIASCVASNAHAQSNTNIPAGGARFMVLNTNPSTLNIAAEPNSTSGFNAMAVTPLLLDSLEDSKTLIGASQRAYNGAVVRAYTFTTIGGNGEHETPTAFFLGVKTLNDGNSINKSYLSQNDYGGLAVYGGWMWAFSKQWALGGSLMVIRSSYPQFNAGKVTEATASTAGANASIAYHKTDD